MVTDFLCALTFHNGCEDRNMDSRVNNADEPFTCDNIWSTLVQ